MAALRSLPSTAASQPNQRVRMSETTASAAFAASETSSRKPIDTKTPKERMRARIVSHSEVDCGAFCASTSSSPSLSSANVVVAPTASMTMAKIADSPACGRSAFPSMPSISSPASPPNNAVDCATSCWRSTTVSTTSPNRSTSSSTVGASENPV